MAQAQSISGRTALITGTGGLGLETAKALAMMGARVLIAGRNADKGAAAVTAVRSVAPGADVTFVALDLANLASIAEASDHLLSHESRIDILVNNAGVMAPPKRRETADGFEVQFGTNHLGHFALTLRLLPLLRQSEAASVVHVTSLAHRYAKMEFDDLHNTHRYKPGIAYCQSKLAVALFARALQHRAEAEGWPILSMAAHPGFAGTNLIAAEQGAGSLMSRLSSALIVPLIGQSAAAGARPQIHAASAESVTGGALYGPKGFMEMRGPVGDCRYAKAALDDDAAQRLWHESERLCGLSL